VSITVGGRLDVVDLAGDSRGASTSSRKIRMHKKDRRSQLTDMNDERGKDPAVDST